MYTAKDATAKWNMSPEQIEHFNTLTNQHDMSDYLKEIAVENNLVRPLDAGSPDVLVDVPQAAPVVPETKTVKINGVEVSGTQTDIDAAMKNAFNKEAQNDQPARDRNGRYQAEPAKDTKLSDAEALKVADRAMLDLAWKRGELSTEQFLDRSGALDNYLASRGIDVSAQREQAREGQETQRSWAEAVDGFKQTEDGQNAPYSPALAKAVGEKIIALGLSDYPSVESVQRAYNALAIEAEMSTCQDIRRMEELKEMHRVSVEGRSGQPDYRR
jgi:hypothetical protein